MENTNGILTEHLPRQNARRITAAQHPESDWRPRRQEPDQLFCFKFHWGLTPDYAVHFADQVIDILGLDPAARPEWMSSRIFTEHGWYSTWTIAWPPLPIQYSAHYDAATDRR